MKNPRTAHEERLRERSKSPPAREASAKKEPPHERSERLQQPLARTPPPPLNSPRSPPQPPPPPVPSFASQVRVYYDAIRAAHSSVPPPPVRKCRGTANWRQDASSMFDVRLGTVQCGEELAAAAATAPTILSLELRPPSPPSPPLTAFCTHSLAGPHRHQGHVQGLRGRRRRLREAEQHGGQGRLDPLPRRPPQGHRVGAQGRHEDRAGSAEYL
jgi:hypothetical protein